MNYNDSSNINCVRLTIKCISFESIHYTIYMYIISSFMIFSEFYYMFVSMYCQFEQKILFFSSKNNYFLE